MSTTDAPALSCPRCRGPMQLAVTEGTPLHLCPGCHGMWLESGKLGEATERAADPARPAARQEPGERPCPRCPVGLDRRPYADGYDIVVDVCPFCHGVYLDRGELAAIRRIAKRLKVPPGTAVGSAVQGLLDRRNRVLTSRRPTIDIGSFVIGALFVGAVLLLRPGTWMRFHAMGLTVSMLIGGLLFMFLGDRYFTEFGWFRFLGPRCFWPYRSASRFNRFGGRW